MPEDLVDQLRPITVEEWPRFIRAMYDVFGDEPSGRFLDTPSPWAELDRSLALWDADRVVATAGIYSRQLTVPGAVVPCAGITWITVAPTHRRRGVLTAIMRRQLDDIRAAEREPVAAPVEVEQPPARAEPVAEKPKEPVREKAKSAEDERRGVGRAGDALDRRP